MNILDWTLLPIGYIGPGAGMGLLAALFGLVVAIVTAMFAVVFWPIRRWCRCRRVKHGEEKDTLSESGSDA